MPRWRWECDDFVEKSSVVSEFILAEGWYSVGWNFLGISNCSGRLYKTMNFGKNIYNDCDFCVWDIYLDNCRDCFLENEIMSDGKT